MKRTLAVALMLLATTMLITGPAGARVNRARAEDAWLAGAGCGDACMQMSTEAEVDARASDVPRDVLYGQPPAVGLSINASTAFNSEVADDLPDSLAGRTVREVTLYVSEWAAANWIDPQGIVVRFYDGSCPPPLEAAVTCTIGWHGIITELLDWSPPTRIVYSSTFAIEPPVVLSAGMSIGATVITSWGAVPPYAGLTMSTPGDINGCGEAYWDDETHGAVRWTRLSDASAITADLAFSLAEEGTGVEEAAPTSWGRLKNLFR